MENDDISRRDFVSLSVAAGLAAATVTGASAQERVLEVPVEIETPDGICDAAFVHPVFGKFPGVIIWPDAFGLRPVMREMARRLAVEGYSVLVPNPYYRVAKAPVFKDPSSFNFGDPVQRASLTPLMASINAAGAAERDATAFIAWLDREAHVDPVRFIGTQGYCMGGPLTVRTMAASSERVGAAASFHGGGLVTANPDSPHLLAPQTQGRMYFGIAANDDTTQPDAKTKLKEAWGRKAEVEVYAAAQHGWCVPDMPKQANGQPTYSKPDAERAWGKLLALYKATL